jgi:hypothetical protein
MSPLSGRILAVFIGGPKTLRDARGEWQSSIARDNVAGPVQLEFMKAEGLMAWWKQRLEERGRALA